MKKKNILLFSILLMALTGCQSSDDDDSDSSSTDSTTTYSGVIVDPYIEGAVMCEDADSSGTCDEGEQVSTASTADGKFTFSNPMTLGSTIIVKTQGTHNGVPYTVELSRKVDSTTDTSEQVVSPLTTLASKNLTDSEIAFILQTAGLPSISADDVNADPMDGVSSLAASATDAEIVKLRSSIAVYAFLRLINGSTQLKELTGTELYLSGTTSGGAVGGILSTMVSLVKSGLDPAYISIIQSQINHAPISLPEVTMDDVTKTAVAITDYVAKAGYETCNATSGDDNTKVTAALAAVNTKTNSGANIASWANQLGQRYYAARNKATLSPYKAMMTGMTDIIAGLECESGTFILDDSGTVTCYSE